jgi:hypothetical protein
MKKILFCLFVLVYFGTSCVAIKHIPSEYHTLTYDFKRYQDQGFTFTPYPPSGEYESKGYIEVTYYPEAKLGEPDNYAELISSGHSERDIRERWWVKKLDTQAILDSIFKQARSMEANAFTSLSIVYDMKYPLGTGLGAQVLRIPGVKISGYAVRYK